MPRPDQFFEWQTLVERNSVTSLGSRERLRILWGLFIVLCLAIFGRAAQLELTQGAAFRTAAAQPGRQNEILPAERGRILARDGTVLAEDERVVGLAVQYRYLEDPPNPAWLRSQARSRLPRPLRQQRLAEATADVLAERKTLHRRLADCCGLSPAEWQLRTARIQQRVEAVAKRVNRLRRDRLARLQAAEQNVEEAGDGGADAAGADAWRRAIADLFAEDESRPPESIVIAEQVAYHIVVDVIPPNVAAAIRAEPARYPATKLIETTRRAYPAGSLAANLVGHVGPFDPQSDPKNANDLQQQGEQSPSIRVAGTIAVKRQNENPAPKRTVGRLGVERGFESALRGQPGLRTHLTDHRGQWLATQSSQDATRGGDVVLALDPTVQRAAETLLDRALQGRSTRAHAEGDATAPATGGAIVVMDIHSGELLAAASAPRFDPNLFTHGDNESLTSLLSAPGHPLFDRVSKMALPPGSVFKIITAAAMLETHAITPETPLVCQGYLHEPDRLRCAVYRNSGVGHGEIQLTEALEQSCNVFFFHFGGEMGPGPLVAWAERFGAGRRTGVDLPDEASGRLGTPGSLPRIAGRAWQASDTYGLAVGQGPLAVTPLQVARWVAAIANGGTLVTPRVTRAGSDNSPNTAGAAERLPLAATTLAAIQEGMERVVSNPNGTGYATVRLAWPTIAGKTGTAEIGGDQAEHAWFAGYTPAENPQWAIVVVLEHGGNGATAAGPIARRLVQALHQADYL